MYLELKRCLRQNNIQQFNKALEEASKVADIMNCDRKILFSELANHHDNEGSNILHNAAAHSLSSDDIKYFTRLLDHGV